MSESVKGGGVGSGGRGVLASTVSFGGLRGGSPKVLVIPLCVGETFSTRAGGGSFTAIRELPELLGLGPQIEKLRVYYWAEWCSSNFQCKVSIQWSVTGESWLPSPAEEILSAQTSDTQVVGSWYTDDAKFGILTRALLDFGNASGTAIESGRVTAYLHVVLRS